MATPSKYCPIQVRGTTLINNKPRSDLTPVGRRSSIGVLKMRNLKPVNLADSKKLPSKLSTDKNPSISSEFKSSIKVEGNNTRKARYDGSKRPEVFVKPIVSEPSKQKKSKAVQFVVPQSNLGQPQTVKSRYIRRTTSLRKLRQQYDNEDRASSSSIVSVKVNIKSGSPLRKLDNDSYDSVNSREFRGLSPRKSDSDSRKSDQSREFGDLNSPAKSGRSPKKIRDVRFDVGKDEHSPRKIQRRQTGRSTVKKVRDFQFDVGKDEHSPQKIQRRQTGRTKSVKEVRDVRFEDDEGYQPRKIERRQTGRFIAFKPLDLDDALKVPTTSTREKQKPGEDNRGNVSAAQSRTAISSKKLRFVTPNKNRSAGISSVGEAIQNRRQTGILHGPLLGKTFDLDEDKAEDEENDDNEFDTRKSQTTKKRSSKLHGADSMVTIRQLQKRASTEPKSLVSILKRHSVSARISFKKKNVTFDPQMPPLKTSHAYFLALRKSNDHNEFGLTRQLNTSKFVSCWEAMSYRNSYLKTYHKPVQRNPIVQINIDT